MAQTVWTTGVRAGDEMALTLAMDQNGTVASARLTGIGGPEMLRILADWRRRLSGPPLSWPLPQGSTGPELMLRELILKARNEWDFPYKEEELCHCRAVPAVVVDQAILAGAHKPEQVSRWTSASTACGTCRKDVIAILACRLPVVANGGKKTA
jgi:bacterioferritin-associated ferredoxin